MRAPFSDTELRHAVTAEYTALADLLDASPAAVWDAPSLCVGWRTREVVAHLTMPARYTEAEFMAELEAVAGDFTRLSDRVASRDGALPIATLLDDLRSEVLHGWQPPGGGVEGALAHVVIHGLDITEGVPLRRRVPIPLVEALLEWLTGQDAPNAFGIDLRDVELRADDMDWSRGKGALVSARGQALVLVASGRLLPGGVLSGSAAARFTRP